MAKGGYFPAIDGELGINKPAAVYRFNTTTDDTSAVYTDFQVFSILLPIQGRFIEGTIPAIAETANHKGRTPASLPP
jgi:hypothetical protein